MALFEEIYQAYQEYSVNGTVSGEKNPKVPSGNAPLHTAQAMWVYFVNGVLPKDLVAKTQEALEYECELFPGLIQRSRNWMKDAEGPDDYVGWTSLEALGFENFARNVLQYGKVTCYQAQLRGLFTDWLGDNWRGRTLDFLLGWIRVCYNYNNLEPRKLTRDSWLGRQPQLIAHFQFAASEKPPLWRRVWWALTVATTGWFGPRYDVEGGQDAWILSWVLVQTYRLQVARGRVKESFLCSFACRHFYRRLFRLGDFGNPMSAIFALYFADGHHPTCRFIISEPAFSPRESQAAA